jgi:hypothetical protein
MRSAAGLLGQMLVRTRIGRAAARELRGLVRVAQLACARASRVVALLDIRLGRPPRGLATQWLLRVLRHVISFGHERGPGGTGSAAAAAIAIAKGCG